MLRNRRGAWTVSGLVAAAVALATVGAAVAPLETVRAQATKTRGKGKGVARDKDKDKDKGKNAPVVAKKGDPLDAQAKDKNAARPAALGGTYHFRMRIHAFDDATLVANYYPAKLDTAAPVVMLIHEKERSSLDFEKPVDDLKKQNLAEHLQGLGYAVLSFDLRGHGANARRGATNDRDWAAMVDDLQAAYLFLVDRHNRGELNLARLGVIALGEGANLAAAWAHMPGGAVSQEGRATDLAGLALVSPLPVGSGFTFNAVIGGLAARIPILLMAGERDALSHEAIKKVRGSVERSRQNRVELFPSSLHGYRLLNLEPRATTVVIRFLDSTVKHKSAEWEPRFNLTPVAYTDIDVIRHAKPPDKEKAQDKDKAADREKPAPRAAEKDKEKAKAEAPADKAEVK